MFPPPASGGSPVPRLVAASLQSPPLSIGLLLCLCVSQAPSPFPSKDTSPWVGAHLSAVGPCYPTV